MRRSHLVYAASAVALLLLSALAQSPAPFDLIIRGARIVDGTGNPWYHGEVALRGDSIVAVARAIEGTAKRTLDAHGQVVSPGFIDPHTHAIRGIFQVPTADNYVRQGVTTIFEGPDGGSPVPLRPFLDKLARTPITPNWGMFVGQGAARRAVVGNADRKATAAEIERMKEIVRQGMRDGAFGLSSGLFYTPGSFTPTEEVIELARVAGEMGGIYISHMREEAAGVLESTRETIRIGEEGHLPTQITHHKIIGTANWGKSAETLKLVDEARARGVDATIDQYPYTASSTSIQSALLPKWALEGTREQQISRLRQPESRARIKSECVHLLKNERGGGDPRNVVIAACAWDASLAGKNLAEIARLRGMEVNLENAAEAVLWIVEQGGCSGIFHAIGEEDLVRILRYPATMIGSDGEIPLFGVSNPHPRSYGTFVRVLGIYVREKRVLTLEEAVRKMTSAPAQRLGLQDRGILRPGMKADVAIFDPSTIRDTATFENPHSHAAGISTVIINGEIAFENGSMTSARPGRVLRGPAFR